MLAAQKADALFGEILFSEPLAPAIRQASRWAHIDAIAAKQAFLTAPRIVELRRNFRELSPVYYSYGGLPVDFFANPKTPAAQNANVVVAVYERIVFLYFFGIVKDGKVDVFRK